jgi:hypothetical protein
MSSTSTLEKYIKEMSEDVKVDEFNLKDVQMSLPALKHKWVGRLMRHKKNINDLLTAKSSTKYKVVRTIQDGSSYKVANAVAEKQAEFHDTIVKINNQVKEEKLIVELLEKAEKIFNSMTFDIKNITEIVKLETL